MRVLSSVLLLCGLGFLIFTVIQMLMTFLGFPVIMSVTGISMFPVYQPHDLLVLKWITPEDVQVGLIVALDQNAGHHPYPSILVHRVTEIIHPSGQDIMVQTKGDYNSYYDSWVPIENIIAAVSFHIPFLGIIVMPPGNIIVMSALFFLAIRLNKK